ncbi:putative copper-transporting ATPase PacS [Porphyromonas levii]|uniref:heavy metal translocating P-type ATPase n=1 Tax=Porphyromonas levii TaxID=28114 RepID=UPI001BA44FD0|nr:heavy metal translocating P-type ATPase [Porphyromonas levii]MBR8766419.1 putative copper-transporting ATPase PacS [Porphyromonas levii]
MEKKIFTVTGMSCAGCVAAVQSQLNKAKGVSNAEVHLLEGRTVITYDERKTSPEQLRDEVRSLGYDMLIEERTEVREALRTERERAELSHVRTRLIVTVLLTIVMMAVSHLGVPERLTHLVMLILATVIMFYSAGGYHKRALKQLTHLTFTMDTLISMSVSVAYFFSLIRYTILGTIEEGGLFGNSYFDVVGMVMSFVLLGKYIEERAKYKTNDALRNLMALTPETALVRRGDEWVELHVDEIQIGDYIRLRKGDRVPVDGLLQEHGTFDESSITGEPLPVNKESGSEVFSGTVSVGAVTTLQATKVGSATLLGRIIDAVRQAQASKAPIQRIADKVSGVFVPFILAIALFTLVAWGVGGIEQPWLHGIYFAISVLCIACPCALGLATPTAITVAMGKASKEGLLIRDAVALERLAKVSDIVYDKTGTLTEGTSEVIAYAGDMSQEQEALLVRAELQSSHPLAAAILSRFSMMQHTAEPQHVEEVAGVGLRFEYQGDSYFVGNKRPASLSVAHPLEEAHPLATFVYYTKGEQLLALLVVEDKVRPDSREALQQLHRETGATIHLLSGDRLERAQALGQELGIAEVRGGLSPLDKKSYIEALQQQGKVVAMVGDGINDSPALATADLSIAMSSGSDIANSVSQVTVIGGSPYALERAIRLSRKTVRIIHQNFFWAFVYNLLAVPIAAGVFYPNLFVSPMIAAAAMAFSSVCVVLNSLRLQNSSSPQTPYLAPQPPNPLKGA